ncbi:hypothetical protein SMICM304S_05421 [Streptomyces microflavus]
MGSSLTCTFRTLFRLVGSSCTRASKEPEEFREPRPIRAELFVETADGTVHEKKLTFNDKPGPQEVRTGISDVVSVRLVLREAAGQDGGRPIASAGSSPATSARPGAGAAQTPASRSTATTYRVMVMMRRSRKPAV